MSERERQNRRGDGPNLVYDGLRRLIIEQALSPGARLPEDAIAARFAVSRTIVRSALGRLAAEGLVDRPNNRGARVASPSLEEAADLFAIRGAIEGLVVTRLAGHLTEDGAQRLRTHLERERQAQGANAPEAIRLAGEFHVLLAELTGSAALRRYVSDLVSRSSLVLAGDPRPHSSDCAVSEHLELIAHLQSSGVKAAQTAMADHLRSVARRALLPQRRRASSFAELQDTND
jgi:DNA-binding GntR family transcriptional regulator